MTITINCTGYLGINCAKISVDPIALVIGQNGSGKSSLIGAAAAALTGQTLPNGIKKKDAGTLVNGTRSEAKVTITGEEGAVTLTLPQCSASTTGKAPISSSIAAGLTNIAAMEDKERAAALIQILKADPTLRDLVTAIADADLIQTPSQDVPLATEEEAEAAKGLPIDVNDPADRHMLRAIMPLWRDIQSQGWDGKASALKAEATKLKGAWEAITGERYGAKKADGWAPKSLPNGANIESVSAAVDAAARELEEALRSAGGQKADVERLRDVAGRKRPDLQEIEDKCNAAEDEFFSAQQAVATAPIIDDSQIFECPHCSGMVVVRDDHDNRRSLTVATLLTPQAIAEAKEVRCAAERRLSAARTELGHWSMAVGKARQEIQDINAAAVKLSNLDADKIFSAEMRIVEARAALAAAEAAASAFSAWQRAGDAHRKIMWSIALSDILAPTGLRRQVLASVLDMFNQRLSRFCDVAGWPRVAVKEDMSLIYGTRPAKAPFASEGQLWRASVVLQVAIAAMDGSDMVLIDRADVLDSGSRGGLIKLLRIAGMPALIAMTAHPSVMPRSLHGMTWLLDQGQAQSLKNAEQQ